MRHATKQLLLFLLIITFISTSALVPAARSATIDTSTYLNNSISPTQAELQSLINQEDVRDKLIALGVDPDNAAQRIAALTPSELNQLQENMGELPAGANALAILGGLLLVLIVLEVLGVTNVFTKL